MAAQDQTPILVRMVVPAEGGIVFHLVATVFQVKVFREHLLLMIPAAEAVGHRNLGSKALPIKAVTAEMVFFQASLEHLLLVLVVVVVLIEQIKKVEPPEESEVMEAVAMERLLLPTLFLLTVTLTLAAEEEEMTTVLVPEAVTADPASSLSAIRFKEQE